MSERLNVEKRREYEETVGLAGNAQSCHAFS